MKKYMKLINDILVQVYQEEALRRCIAETIHIHRDRIVILHQVVMNIDRLSSEEIREKAYCYGKTIKPEDLLARQIFLCLLHLAKIQQ